MRRAAEVNHPIIQQQPGPVHVPQRIKRHIPLAIVPVARARHACLNDTRPAEFLRAARDVQRVQPMNISHHVGHHFSGFGLDVDGAGNRINDRRAGDADFRHEVAATHIAAGNGRDARRRVDEADLPQRRGIGARVAVGVERIHAVVLGGDIEHVVGAFAGNRHVGHDQRLGIDITVHRVTE